MKPSKRRQEHPTFYRTVIESPQWKLWEQEQAKRLRFINAGGPIRGIYDMPEVVECGWISQEHFQEFLKFCGKQKPTHQEIER